MKIIAIASGKGGVGKSTVSVNLALALHSIGVRVGVLDMDLYGPSIGMMLPSETKIREEDGYIIPATGLGVQHVSLSHFPMGKSASIVRAPIANQIVSEFLTNIRWNDLDILLIDCPPGTGDIQLTMMQEVQLAGAILVTTPQQVAIMDVKKAYEMFMAMKVPVLGVVENMSFYDFEGNKKYPFGKEGGEAFCKEHELTLLGQIPIDEVVASCGDRGISLIDQYPSHLSTRVFENMAYMLSQVFLKKEPLNLLYIKEVCYKDPCFMKIIWSDERRDMLKSTDLQRHCPCKRCQNNQDRDVEKEVEIQRVTAVGNYAVHIEFTKGCRFGFYPLEVLRNLGESYE